MDWTTDAVGGGNREPRLDDLVEKLVVPDGEAKEGRFIGPARRVARHWMTINKKAGGTARIPRVCLAWNDETGAYDATTKNADGELVPLWCPYCAIDPKTPNIEVHQNFIDRDAQAAEPRKVVPPSGSETRAVTMKGFKCFLKSGKSSRAFTPVRLAVLNSGHSNPIKDMVGTNKKKVRDEDGNSVTKVFGPEHPQHGFDVSLLYNSTRAAAQRYNAIRGDSTPLEAHERRYLLWDIYTEKAKSLAEATTDAKQLAKVLVDESDNADGDGRHDKRGSGGAAGGSKARTTTIDDNEDWDSDEPPARSAKRRPVQTDDDLDDAPPARSAKRRPAPVDDDDLDDAPPARGKRRAPVDDDLDEDEPPRRSAKRRPASVDEDDLDDAPPARSAKRRPVQTDDFDDEPPARSAKRRAPVDDDLDDAPPARSAKPKARRPEPDDDDLGDDDDWDD